MRYTPTSVKDLVCEYLRVFTFVLAGSTVYTRTIDGTAFRPGLPFQVLLFVVYTPGVTQNGG